MAQPGGTEPVDLSGRRFLACRKTFKHLGLFLNAWILTEELPPAFVCGQELCQLVNESFRVPVVPCISSYKQYRSSVRSGWMEPTVGLTPRFWHDLMK